MLFQLACLIAADENFKHGAAVAVDKVERASSFAHERAFQKVDGGAVFVIDMTVYAAIGFRMVKVVETAADFAVRQFAADFDDGIGVWAMKVTDSSHAAMAWRISTMRLPSVWRTFSSGRQRITSSKLHWFCAASIPVLGRDFFPMIDATWFVVRLKVFAWFDPFLESEE